MKNKSDLKRKVLCSLLAASTMGIFYSSDALAASVNGVNPDLNNDGIITDAELIGLKDSEGNNVGSKKFVIAQGDKLVIATEGNVNSLIKDIQAANGDLNAIRTAIADHSVVGVIGGEGQLDTGLQQFSEAWQTGDVSKNINGILTGLLSEKLGTSINISDILGKVENIDTVKTNEKTITGDTNLTIGGVEIEEGKIASPVVIGAIGGDLSVNTGLNGNLNMNFKQQDSDGNPLPDVTQNDTFTATETSITRDGNVNLIVKSGNVLGGVGGSAAVSVGNIEVTVDANIFLGTMTADGTINLDGKTTTTINGDINTIVAGEIDTAGVTEGGTANIGAFANGGAAIAIGGQADSIVNGDSNLVIDSNVTINDNAINGLTAGVTGGGVALTTIGGTANSAVNGNVNIGVNNGLAIGVVGGGIAGSGDATGAVELIQGGQVGHNDGTADKDINLSLGEGLVTANATIDVTDATYGGNATATTGDTNINLTGNTTAIGVIGGGVAAASHTFTIRPETDGAGEVPEGQKVNDAYGSSNATAETGKATIVVDLESEVNPDNVAGNIGGALGGIIDAATSGGNVTNIINGIQSNAGGIVGQGGVVGVFGGGVAFGHGSMRATINAKGEGAYALANNAGGADLYLLNGYAAGVFGGGAAGTLNNAKAETNTGAVNTYIGEDMKAVGVFGGGFALSMEGQLSETDPHKGTTYGSLAYSDVTSNNIEVYGDVDGIYGGGMAIGNSILSSDNPGKDAATHVGTTNITVNSGTIDRLQLISIMDASKNDNNTNNDEGWQKSPWWNSLGMNASMAMVDLKGITDETSISAGGMAMSMSGSDTVDKANITINGGEITKDILGGGIAVDNSVGSDNKETTDVREGAGAHVGESTITLNGGTVGGSIYAGGAINGTTPEKIGEIAVDGHKGFNTDSTSSTVGEATVILNGTEVTGEISGQGYELTTDYSNANGDFNPYDKEGNYVGYEYIKNSYDSVGTSTLQITGNNTLKPLETSKDDNYISDDSKIHSFDNINVAAGSVTALEGLTTDSAAIIDATGTEVKVDGSAKLDINDFKAGNSETGNEYKVISNTDAEDDVWTNDNLVYDRTEAYAQNAEKDGEYTINYKTLNQLTEEEKTDAVNDFVGSLGEGGENFEGAVNGIIRNGENTNAGAKDFFSDYTKGEGTSRDLAAMAMIGEAAGVTSNTIDVAGDMADNSVLRLSFTQDDITGEPKVNEDGAIWAKYIHNKHDLDGMASSFGSVDSSSDFDGATIGVDFAKKGKVQSGIAFSYGSGDSHGMGINNDFDMWGVSLYGNVKNDDTNVIADIGFSESDNELTGTAMGKDIKADRDVSVFTVGVRAEKMYTNGSTQIVPYTGLRYYNVDPDSYTAYYDGQKFGEYDADRQNIWTLPVGVSLRNETVTESGWRLTPKVDVAYIWAFGDTDNSFDLNTGSGVDTLDYTVMDSGSWLGSVGFEAGKDDWAFGVGYSYQKGSHEEANKWFVNVEYSF